MQKNRIVFLSELFDELKQVEEMFDKKEWSDLDKKYVKGFKDCIDVVTKKSMELCLELEIDNEDLSETIH